MPVIDDKVVAMSFESSKFEAGVHNTISALDKLKASLKLPTSIKSFDDIGAAAKKIDLSHIGRSLDTLVQKLGYFSVAAIAIFANVATQAVQAGARMIKGLSLDPIIAGYKEYATNLNSIQTILANTEASGATLKDVNAALLELNKYSDKTIYNFSQMARNIGTFTAAGVDLDTSVGAIKGIANLAALSGSSADQASTAMYQLSQAISAGSVKLMDWNSVVNAGMGGTVFQRALANTAETMGTLKKGTVELTGPMKNVSISGESFRNSLSTPGKDSWLTSKVLTTTLKQFTGDLKDSELAAMGFNAQQIKAIQQTAKTATYAATEVKTLTQTLDVAKETAGSGWAQTWQIIFGDFGEAKKTFTALSESINGFINKNAEARNKVLGDWKALGGRTLLIEGITTMFKNLGAILKPIKEAFRDIFPAKTGQDLFSMTQGFVKFANALKPSAETVENLKRTFAGLFAVFSIIGQVVSGVFTIFKELFGALGGGSGGFLSLTASVGDFFVAIDKALKKGNKLHNFFKSLGQILAVPVEMLSKVAGVIGDVFSGFSSTGITSSFAGITGAAAPLQAVLQALAKAWKSFANSIRSGVDLSSILESIGESLSGIGVAIGKGFSGINFDAILQVIKTGLFAGLVLMFKQFLGRGSLLNQITKGFGSGILGNISGIFDGLNGSMKAFQTNLKAKTLKEIAIAIALLAASLLLISLIKPERLNASLGAMTIMFGQLIAAMAILDKLATSGGFLKLPFIVASLIGLSVAIGILTISVFALSRLSWEELLKGLGGIAVLLGTLAAASIVFSANAGGMIRASIAIIAIGIGLNILALAVRQLSSLSLSELAKGLGGVAGGLVIIARSMMLMPKGMIVQAVAIGILAVALNALALAVRQFGTMDLMEMGIGLAGIAASLIIIAGAMNIMPKGMVLQAAALVLISVALNALAKAIQSMGGMSMEEIAKGLGTLGGSLVILSVGLKAMTGAAGGAAALTLAAVGLALLVPSIVLLGQQSIGDIAKGLIAMAGALTVIGVASRLIGAGVPGLLAFGVAIVLIGSGLALAGAGMFLFSAGLSAILVAGPAAVGILIAALNEFLLAIPKLATSFALGMLAVVEAFAKTAPQFVDAMVKIMNSLLDVIIKSSPKVAEAITAIINLMIKVLGDNQAKIIAAGFSLLIALLQGIKNNIAQVTTMVISIVVKFIQTLTSNLNQIIKAGLDLLMAFLRGIANNLALIVTGVAGIITKFIAALTAAWTSIITAGANLIVKLVEGIAKNAGKIVTAGADAIIDFVTGLGKNASRVVTAGVDAVIEFIKGLGKNAVRLANAAGEVIVDFLNGLTKAINKYTPQIQEASKQLGWAIINGMTWGLAGKAQDLYDLATSIASKVLSILKKVPGVSSPAKATIEIGEFMMDGLRLGMDKAATNVYSSAHAISNGLISVFTTVLQTNSPSKVLEEIGKFVGQGFAKGLRGSQSDINSAFLEMNGMLTDAMKTSRETIISEQKNLDTLLKEKKPDNEAIAASRKLIAENQEIFRKSKGAHDELTGSLRAEKDELVKLAGQYEVVSTKLEAAQEKLKTAKAEREALKTEVSDRYSTLPEITKVDAEGAALVDQVGAYKEKLKVQTDEVKLYSKTLNELRKLGLDNDTYEKLLAEGTINQAFATQLLSGGRTAIEGLNKLDRQLNAESKKLGVNAARELKQAGVDGALGLIKGLLSQKAELIREMQKMADEIVAAFNRRLRARSPSEVFAESGVYIMQGLAKGIVGSKKMVTDAMADVADATLDALKSTMAKISTEVSDTTPVITPILDLTQVKAQAGELRALTNVSSITAAASYAQASIISAAQIAAQADEMSTSSGSTVTFEQNNYSPTALTEIEIYRQTRNQLSQLKSTLVTT